MVAGLVSGVAVCGVAGVVGVAAGVEAGCGGSWEIANVMLAAARTRVANFPRRFIWRTGFRDSLFGNLLQAIGGIGENVQ